MDSYSATLKRMPQLRSEVESQPGKYRMLGEKGAGALKALTTEAVNEYLSDHRARRLELEADPAAIDQILADGNERANAVADATLEEVRAGMGMAY